MNEDDTIRKLTEGRDNPFRVPDGYFDDFTGRLLSRLPEPKPKPHIIAYAWRYAAVLLVALGIGLTVFLTTRDDYALAESEQAEQYHEDYINDVLDYALISNSNIEIYLTEAQ